MKIFGDYHTHTVLSHGKGTIRENVQRAREIKLNEIAITDHGLNHIIFGLNPDKVSFMIDEIKRLREEYADINILIGIEANIIGTRGIIDLKPEQFKLFDIILCGFHRPAMPDRLRDWFGMYLRSYLKIVPQGRRAVQRNTTAYVEAIRNNPIDIVTHINKGVKVDTGEIAKVCAEYGTYIELSGRHLSLKQKDIDAMLKTDVKFIVNTDAHRVEDIGDIKPALVLINKYNIPLDRIINLDKRPVFRSERNVR